MFEVNSGEKTKKIEKKVKNSERMKNKRASASLSKGRPPGINGRPPLLLHSEKEYIYSRIYNDCCRGVFHRMDWLQQLVSDINYIRSGDEIIIPMPSKRWAYEFVKDSSKLCLRRPSITEKKRILACTRPNIERFYKLVASKFDEFNYPDALKVNIDETPLLIKRPYHSSVISTVENLVRPVEPPPNFIFKCTAVPVICSDGTFLCAAILFPIGYDVSVLQNHFRNNFVIYSTEKGSMTKEIFDKFMRDEVFTRIGLFFGELFFFVFESFIYLLFIYFILLYFFKIGVIQKKIQQLKGNINPVSAVIFLDGHSSRRNKQLWDDSRKLHIHAISSIAHSTHLTQALDRVVNARLKRLLQNARAVPTKSNWKTDFEAFVLSVEDAIEESCLGKNIRSSFEKCGIVPYNPDCVLKEIPENLDPEIIEKYKTKERKINLFEINCKCLTDKETLKEWENHEKNRKRQKNSNQRWCEKLDDFSNTNINANFLKVKRKRESGSREISDDSSFSDGECDDDELQPLSKKEKDLLGSGREEHFIMFQSEMNEDPIGEIRKDISVKIEELEQLRMKKEECIKKRMEVVKAQQPQPTIRTTSDNISPKKAKKKIIAQEIKYHLYFIVVVEFLIEFPKKIQIH